MTYLTRKTTKEQKAEIAADCFRIQKRLDKGIRLTWHSMGLCANMSSQILYRSFKDNYPFGGYGLYAEEKQSDSLWKNKERLAFIRRWAKKHEKSLDAKIETIPAVCP